MRNANRTAGVLVGCMMLLGVSGVWAQDWPQWRGPNRDAVAKGFQAPATWPKELTQKWKVTVGDGVATPALVGDKLYVFSRQDDHEIIRCFDAATGKELWQNKYREPEGVRGFASRFSGPRCSPTVADGKVVTLGVQGTLCCFDAATGKQLWRNDDYEGSIPRFSTSSSPIVVDGLCIAQLGGPREGVIAAYDLATGEEKWKWPGESPAYGSPVVVTVGGTRAIVTPTEGSLVAIGVSDGKLLWRIPYKQGRYNAATPIVEGQLLIYAGPGSGTTAVKLEQRADGLAVMELWRNPDNSVQFNTPVLKDGFLYGITNQGTLFCVNAQNGQTAWTASLSAGAGAERQPGAGAGQRGQRGRRGRGGPGGREYGSVVDAGSVLFALTPSGQLTVFEPSSKEFKQIASYKVADGQTYAYPVVAGNRIYVKDQDSVTLWTIE